MAKLNIGAVNSKIPTEIHDRYESPAIVNGSHIGGIGGNTYALPVNAYAVTCKIGNNAVSANNAGWIFSQKGARKFRVTDNAGNFGVCRLVNLPGPQLTNNQMSMLANIIYMPTANVTQYGTGTTAYVNYVSSTTVGPVPLAVGQQLAIPGVAGNAIITASNIPANSYGNLTITFPSQTLANVGNTAINAFVYLSRINNKYVCDFGNASVAGGSGIPKKYRFHFAAPDNLFIQVTNL